MLSSHFHKTLSTFQNLSQKAQPKLDAARYRAEANFSPRRGFLHRSGGGEKLIDGSEDDGMDGRGGRGGYGNGMNGSGDERGYESLSDEEEMREERERTLRRLHGAGGGGTVRARDEMRWPVSNLQEEGWKPL